MASKYAKLALSISSLFFLALLFTWFGVSSWAQSISFTPESVTFTQRETMPVDYGVTISATGEGVWTLGLETGCFENYVGDQSVALEDIDGKAIPAGGSITLPATIYAYPNPYNASAQPAGSYECTIPWTNGDETVNLAVSFQIVPKFAPPVYLNGLGIHDSFLAAASGCSQVNTQALSFSYNLNSCPCTNCRPGGTFNPPAPGSSWTDELGNKVTVLTPSGHVHQNSQKSAVNKNNTLALVLTIHGNTRIFDISQAKEAYSDLNDNVDMGGQGAWGWSTTDPNSIYTVVHGKHPQVWKKITLGRPPNYTAKSIFTWNGPDWIISNSMARADVNNSNWIAFMTGLDHSGVVDVSGSAVTWVSGDRFDSTFVEQRMAMKNGDNFVGSVQDATHLTLTKPPGDGRNISWFYSFPKRFCFADLVAMEAQGQNYNPVCTDLFAISPRGNYAQGSIAIAKDWDSETGKMYAYGAQQPYSFILSMSPGDTSLTARRAPLQFFNHQTRYCDDNQAVIPNSCYSSAHNDTFMDGKGAQYIALTGNSGGLEVWKLSAITDNPLPLEAGGADAAYTVPQFYTYANGGEIGGAKSAGYWNVSFNERAQSWPITSCSNTSPIVCTTAEATGLADGTKVLIGSMQGNTAANGSHTAVRVNGTQITLDANGNGTPVANTGAITVDRAIPEMSSPNAGETLVFRDLGVEAHRYGHSRSVAFTGDWNATGFWGVPRSALFPDGSGMMFTTTFGIPDNLQVAYIKFPTTGGVLTPNQFDRKHAVTSVSTTPSSVSLSYSSPDNGDVIVEIGPTRAFNVDDPEYKATVDRSRANPRTTTFSGLKPGTTYHYRAIANQKWLAYGSFMTRAGAKPTAGVISHKW